MRSSIVIQISFFCAKFKQNEMDSCAILRKSCNDTFLIYFFVNLLKDAKKNGATVLLKVRKGT